MPSHFLLLGTLALTSLACANAAPKGTLTSDILESVGSLMQGPLTPSCEQTVREEVETLQRTGIADESKVTKCLGGRYSFIVKTDAKKEKRPSVRFSLKGKVAYLAISSFELKSDSVGTAKEVERALTRVHLEALVLDLRGNTGGYTRAAVDLADLFAPKGDMPIITTVDKDDSVTVYRTTRSGAHLDGVRVMILVDHRTCSSSEIIAGTLKRWYPASVRIVGLKTCGKFVFQNVLDVGAYRIAVVSGQWFYGAVPDMYSVRGGITPDITTANPGAYLWGMLSGTWPPVPPSQIVAKDQSRIASTPKRTQIINCDISAPKPGKPLVLSCGK